MKNVSVMCAMWFGCWSLAWGADRVTNVTVTQNNANRQVTVSYTLEEPAIVTVEMLRDGVSLGPSFSTLTGDVAGRVEAGDRCVVWNPRADLPDEGEIQVQARVTAWDLGAPPPYLAVTLATGEKEYFASAEDVPGGVTEKVQCTAEPFTILLPKGKSKSVQREILLDESAPAPVKAGDRVGTVRYLSDGETVGEGAITALTDTPRITFGALFLRMLGISLVKN